MKKSKNVIKILLCLTLIVTVIGLKPRTSFAAETQYSENVIPKMTSNTSPSGKASASSVTTNTDKPQDFSPYYVFDHGINLHYGWISESSNAWLEYEFPEARRIAKYTLTSRHTYGSLSELPKDWTFEAWDSQLNKWMILDTQNNVLDWQGQVKKVFTINNSRSYNRYRINITATGGHVRISLGEFEMMEATVPYVSAPKNLVATAGDSNISLNWDKADGATGYILKRAEKSGGPYTTIATVSENSYDDMNVINGTTYYYVVSAIKIEPESDDSNEAYATPIAEGVVGNAILVITLDNGTIKEYNFNIVELNNFLEWYDDTSNGIGKNYYFFTQKGVINPFTSIKTYIPYNKIQFFDVKEYN